MNVLIPRNFPGKFYYPPCKCELVNQIRYYNPKTREFYYHKAYTAIPPPHPNNKDHSDYSENSANGSPINNQQIPILGGEPEFYPVPTISENAQSGGYIGSQLQAPSLSLPYPYVPSNQYYKPYINHQMVIYNLDTFDPSVLMGFTEAIILALLSTKSFCYKPGSS